MFRPSLKNTTFHRYLTAYQDDELLSNQLKKQDAFLSVIRRLGCLLMVIDEHPILLSVVFIEIVPIYLYLI